MTDGDSSRAPWSTLACPLAHARQPVTIIAKIAAVSAFSAWRYHRQRKRLESDQRRIDAEYEVLGPDRIALLVRRGNRPTLRRVPELRRSTETIFEIDT